jgi:hypothetical protein
MKKRTYRRKLEYIPNICDESVVFWLVYSRASRCVAFAGSNRLVLSERRRIAQFEHWSRIAFRYWSY